MLLVAFCFSLSTLAAECSTGGTAKNDCVAGKCETINGVEICTQCAQGFAPVNTGCTAHATANAHCKKKAADLDAQSQICEKCEGDYFLYKNGCYQANSQLGATLCKAAANGVCTTGAEGYFAIPDAAVTEESVAPCNTTEAITLENGHKYLGVSMCTECSKPNAAQNADTPVTVTCTACADKSEPKDNACPSPENPNINKSGLSTGAIAGIAVAAVIVVGGLVGFLCWWFLCRGKA